MINALHLLWIIPLSMALGVLIVMVWASCVVAKEYDGGIE